MAEAKKPIQIGFRNGQSVSLKIAQKEIDKLVAAIEAEAAWHTVQDDTRKLTLRADRIDFYGTDDKPEAHRAGF